MSSTTDFTAELFRAANQIETLTSFERVRLIERAARLPSKRNVISWPIENVWCRSPLA